MSNENQITSKSNKAIYFLSFFIPTIAITIIYAIIGIFSFGEKSLLIMDMNEQYVNFYGSLKHFISDGGLFVNWFGSLGSNFMGTFAYYLCSPFTIIPILFPTQNLTEAIFLMNILKIGSCGLTFAVFCLNGLKLKKSTALIGSIAYSLMAYTVVYSICLMWLDGVIFAPLVLLGTYKLVTNNQYNKVKGFAILTVSLAFTFITSYYISYMVGVFAFLFFVATYFSTRNESTININDEKFLPLFARFMLSAVIAIMISGAVNLPNFYSLIRGKLDSSSNFNLSYWNLNPLDFLSQLSFGSYSKITDTGLPNIYCSSAITLLATTFFFNKSFSKKEKLSSLIVLFTLVITICIGTTNIMWHLFQVPTWFPYRQSFVISLYLIYLAVKSLDSFTSVSKVKILYSFIITVGITGVSYFHKANSSQTIATLVLLIIFLILLLFVKIFTVKNNDLQVNNLPVKKNHPTVAKVATAMLSIILVGELTFNGVVLCHGLDNSFSYQNRADFIFFVNNTSDAVDYIKQQDSSFYRIEKDFERTKNDSMLLGYKGISHYSSDYNRSIMQLTHSMGIAQSHFWTSNLGATELTNSIFGVKYIMSKNSLDYSNYTYLTTINDIKIYKNENALQLAYSVKDDFSENTMYNQTQDLNVFEVQNRYLNNILGYNNDYFKELSFKTSNKNSYIEYSVTAQKDGEIYFYAGTNDDFMLEVKSRSNSFSIPNYNYKNGASNTLLGNFKKGETVKVKAHIQDSSLLWDVTFAGLDYKLLSKTIDDVKKHSLNITSYNNNTINGTLLKSNDMPQVITSIPFDEGWEVFVNGNKVDSLQMAGSMLGFDLTRFTGQVDIKLVFTPKGFNNGLIMSLVGVVLLIIFCFKLKKYKFSR